MPEGDAIFRTARTLHRALAGKPIVRFETVLATLARVNDDAPIRGRHVERVTAAGKHVLIVFSARNERHGRLALRTHMRMNGSWHVYPPGARWRRPRRDMRIVIATKDVEAVAFTVPVAEFLDERAVRRSEPLRQLGPDLLGDAFDEAEAVRRLRDRPDRTIAEALLDQRTVAGIGNIYKSEVLFLSRVHPETITGRLTDDDLRRILAKAGTLLRVNVTHPRGGIATYRGFRRSRTGGQSDQTYVYGRAGKPCRRCGASILVRAAGLHARLTYWCPVCQPAGQGLKS